MTPAARIETVAFWVRALESLDWFEAQWAEKHNGGRPTEDERQVFIDEYVDCRKAMRVEAWLIAP